MNLYLSDKESMPLETLPLLPSVPGDPDLRPVINKTFMSVNCFRNDDTSQTRLRCTRRSWEVYKH